MKRATIECWNMQYQNYILIEDMNDIQEYIENQTGRKVEVMKKLIERTKTKVEKGYVNHPDDLLVARMEDLSHIIGGGSVWNFANTTGQKEAAMIIYVAKGKKLAVNHVGGYFPIPEDAMIKSINKVVYTEKDIKITKFEGGRHFYATIAGVEVLDEFGGRKWNTYQYAEEMAIKFLSNLNK